MPLARAGLVALPFLIGLVAMAGLVHIGLILAYPTIAKDDAFGRIAALAPIGIKTPLPFTEHERLPFGDAAMVAAVCRFDLDDGPFRIKVSPFDSSFLSLGVHSRRGIPFYGLNVQAGAGETLTIVVMTEVQNAAAERVEVEEGAIPDLRIVSPESQGMVVLQTPADEPATLDQVRCDKTIQSTPRSAS